MKTKNEVNNYEPNVVSDVTPKEKKKLNKKQKIIIAICSAILVIVLAIASWYLYERNVNKWELKTTEITVEYGENVSINIDNLVDTEIYTNINTDNTIIEAKDIQYDDNYYLSIGEYDIEVAHKIEYKFLGLSLFSADDVKKATLIISDTVAPVFDVTSPTEIEFTKDCKEDITDKYKANDLQEVTITLDDENVDYSTVGEYTANVYATDASGNVATYEIKIKINEPKVELNVNTLNITVGDTYQIEAKVTGKNQDVEWSSSDESVATVDGNGVVTAIAKGTATVKAKANGTETSATVAVTSKSSSTNNSTNNSSKSTTSSSSSGTKSSSGGSSSSNGKTSSSSSGTASTTTTEPYWCTEGGSHHIDNVGQIGWYSTYDAALSATMTYMKQVDATHFTIVQCSCGLYTAYVN